MVDISYAANAAKPGVVGQQSPSRFARPHGVKMCDHPDTQDGEPDSSYEAKVDRRLAEVLSPQTRTEGLVSAETRAKLERFRVQNRSGNEVYRIPLEDSSDDFIIVKLLPNWQVELRRLRKALLRSLIYGERSVDYSRGKKRAAMETSRYREWQAAGMSVPSLIETDLADVRIIQGLQFPTFQAFLSSEDRSVNDKLRAISAGLDAISHQHRFAISQDKDGLVHAEPSPQNMMFDPETDQVYWFDLEHPAEYAHMSVEDVATRALRIYLYGALDFLPDHTGNILALAVERYEPKALLWRVADSVERSLNSFLIRTARLLGLRQRSSAVQGRMVRQLRATLHEWEGSTPG